MNKLSAQAEISKICCIQLAGPQTHPHAWWSEVRPLPEQVSILKSPKIQNLVYCRFALSHHHQNHSTSNVKNHRGKRRWIFKQCRKDSGLCNVSRGRYSKKCFTQIYKAMYGDAMFVSLWGQIWRPEANKNICHRVFYKDPVVVFWGLINIYMIYKTGALEPRCGALKTKQAWKSNRKWLRSTFNWENETRRKSTGIKLQSIFREIACNSRGLDAVNYCSASVEITNSVHGSYTYI